MVSGLYRAMLVCSFQFFSYPYYFHFSLSLQWRLIAPCPPFLQLTSSSASPIVNLHHVITIKFTRDNLLVGKLNRSLTSVVNIYWAMSMRVHRRLHWWSLSVLDPLMRLLRLLEDFSEELVVGFWLWYQIGVG